METGVERVSTSAYTRIGAEAQIGAEIKKATEKLSAEGKEVTSIQQEQPFNGAVFWTIHANISWRTIDNSSQQPSHVVATPQITINANATTESLLKRVQLFLEDKEWDKANAYCENILDQNPECAEAYLYLLLAETKISSVSELTNYYNAIKDNKNYIRAKKFASDDLKVALDDMENEAKKTPQKTIQASINYVCNNLDFEIEDGELKKYIGSDTHIRIPESVKSIRIVAFSFCSSVKSVYIPKSVIKIGETVRSSDGNCFISCNGIESIVVDEGNPYYDSRENCNAIIKTKTNTIISGCKNSTIVSGIAAIGQDAFSSGCPNNLYIPKSVNSINSSAFSCRGISTIVVDSENPIYDSRGNCNAIIETATNTLVQGCGKTIIPKSVTSFGRSAFSECNVFTKFSVPGHIKSIGDYCFYSCEQLQVVIIQDGVQKIGENAFFDCKKLSGVTIPNSVTSIGERAFGCCIGLKSITIPDSVTSIGEDAFDSSTQINASEIIEQRISASKKNTKSSGGGCYVATAVYGSYDCPEVWTLRRFRDYSLALTWHGRLFIALYYAISPTIVKWFGHTQWFNRMWRGKLDKMVKRLQEEGFEDTPYEDLEW